MTLPKFLIRTITVMITVLAANQIVQANEVSTESVAETATEPSVAIKRDFVAGPFGQVHVRIAEPKADSVHPPLVLFHPTPYSSDYFTAFMQAMAKDRVVIAIDTPGYGDSDRPATLQTIGGYAASAYATLVALGINGENNQKIDVLGYHTGGLIAAELAVTHPDLVRRIGLPGLPFYMGDARKAAYEENAKTDPIQADGSHLIPKWKFSTGATNVGLSLERGQEHFNDSMQCYPHCWEAYHAVFTYPTEQRLAKIGQPVLLITNAGSLKEETEAARAYLKQSKLVHIPEITLGGFDLHTEKLAKIVRAFLNE